MDKKQRAPAVPPEDGEDAPTIRELRRRGLVYKGGGVTVGSTDQLIPDADLSGEQTRAYLTRAKDLARVLATGWYALGPEPEPPPAPPDTKE